MFLSAFLFCLGVFLLIVFRRNSFKLTVDSTIRVNATIQITKDEIRIAINDNLIICIEIISSFIQRQQRVPHFCQHGDFPLSRITFRHPKSVINEKTPHQITLMRRENFFKCVIFGAFCRLRHGLAHVGTRWHTAQLFCIIIMQKTLQTRQTFELFSPAASLSGTAERHEWMPHRSGT